MTSNNGCVDLQQQAYIEPTSCRGHENELPRGASDIKVATRRPAVACRSLDVTPFLTSLALALLKIDELNFGSGGISARLPILLSQRGSNLP